MDQIIGEYKALVKTVGIVGLGLIGGSLGLELRSQNKRVLGVSRQAQTCDIAMRQGVADLTSQDLAILREAEIIFLCTPLHTMAKIVFQLAPMLPSETILTDVGSVKTSILREVLPLWPNFVGGHPMTGTEKQGIEAAQFGLFTNTPYVITPVAETPPDAVLEVENIARSLSCQLYHCSPEKHDRAVALISHLPLFVSSLLIETCVQDLDPEVLKLAQSFASSGFRDTSRVGGGNPVLGMAIAQYNQSEVVRSLKQYRHHLDTLIEQLEKKDWDNLQQKLEKTQSQRPCFLRNN